MKGKQFRFDRQQRLEKLTKKEQEELVFDLVNAIVQAQNVSEAALFLQDLLTQKEIKTLGKRLRIAKDLLAGMTYKEIEDNLHVSHATVAKIAAWLSEKGDGFRNVIEKLPEQSEYQAFRERTDWDIFKRKYSIYFWPELLLEEVIKSANKKHKERISKVLENLEQKSELHKRIESMLKKQIKV